MPVVPLAATLGIAWIAEHIIEVTIVAAVCGALAVVAVEALARWSDRRDARRAAAGPLLITRGEAAAVAPPGRPAIASAVVFNFYGADSGNMAAHVIRTAIPGQAQIEADRL